MSSYLQKVKNFSHCPLKKRPYHIISDTTSSGEDLDEPQDLRVKRKKEKMEEIESEFVLPSAGTSSNNKNQHRKVNSKFGDVDVKFSNEFSEPAKCLSIFLQNKVAKNGFQIPPLTDFYLQILQQSKGAQPFPSQQQVVLDTWGLNPLGSSWPSNMNQCPSPGTLLPIPLASPSEEIRLSSPQSISSEDSGIGCDYGSEEEEEGKNATKEPLKVSEKIVCGSCGKSFSTHSGLRKHDELHCSSLILRKFSCKYCAKVYKSIGALKMHIRTHTLPCKCHICGKAFSRPWLLQGHIRTHTGEKPFECQQCQRSFADRSNLRAHQQTHERIKKYACHFCHKTFSRISLLNKHTENSCSKHLQDFQK